MKKFYLLFALLVAFAGFSNAQRSASDIIKVKKAEFKSKAPDTLFPESCIAAGSSAGIYPVTGGGWITGTNAYGDLAKVQKFEVATPYTVKGMVVWVGDKYKKGTAGTVKFQLYNFDGTGTGAGGASGTSKPAPKTVLASVSKSIDEIDSSSSYTKGKNIILFDSPVTVTADYGLGLDFSAIGDDTIGVVSTGDGDALGTELTWEKWDNSKWNSMLYAWEVDIDMFIFAIIDDDPSVGINDNYINGIRLGQNQPNPANGNTVIQYDIAEASAVTLEIYDITGRTVYSSNEGMQTAGMHAITLDANQLEKGTYYYSLKAGSNRLTKQMIVQ